MSFQDLCLRLCDPTGRLISQLDFWVPCHFFPCLAEAGNALPAFSQKDFRPLQSPWGGAGRDLLPACGQTETDISWWSSTMRLHQVSPLLPSSNQNSSSTKLILAPIHSKASYEMTKDRFQRIRVAGFVSTHNSCLSSLLSGC